MKTTIIGGGLIGLFSAYYLKKNGHEVVIIEQSSGQDGCSYGNAGMVVPSHFIPLAVPGMIEKGIRWMFDSESPFYVKPRLNLDLLSWGMKFYKAANKKQVEMAMPALRDISLLSKALYQELAQKEGFDFSFEEKGLMMLCKNEHTLEEEVEVAEKANQLGIRAKVLSLEELHQLEPEVRPEVAGAVFYEGDAHLYPNLLLAKIKEYLLQNGVEFLYHSEVLGVTISENKVESLAVKKEDGIKNIAIDSLVIATGSWSQAMAKQLGINMPMQAGKGYSITVEQKEGKKLNIPSILLEARVAITPMSERLIRFGGTMEIGGINDHINMNRVKGIIKSVPNFFPDYRLEMPQKEEVWYGLRPCSPDGLPYIGRASRLSNVVIATGHAMMGLSLAPGTGHLVQQLVDNQATSLDLKLYNPERYA